MKYVYIILFLLIGYIAKSQNIPFQQTKNWKIYLIKDRNKFNYSVDTLKNFKNHTLNSDSILFLFRSVSNLGQMSSPAWMGSHVITYELQNVVRKLDVSVYGGFFYDETTHAYYQVGEPNAKQWLEYLANCVTYLQQIN